MDQIDPGFSEPLSQFAAVQHACRIFRDADSPAAAKRSKDVSHESIEHGRHELAHAAPWPKPKRLDLPADEVINGFEPSRNCFGPASRAGSKEDITETIAIKVFHMPEAIAGCTGGIVQ